MTLELIVQKRNTSQKAKALRESGSLPAVVYGRKTESTPIAVERKAFDKILKSAGESSIITLKGLEQDKQALINDVEVDAVSGEPIHADFYAIEKGQKVTVSVPLEFDGIPPAVKDLGGILTKVMHELEMEVDPTELPHSIKVDVSKLEALDSQIKISDLALPPSAKLEVDLDEVVAMISVAKEEPVEAPPVDLSAIEISEERGKKPDAEGAEGAAPAALAPEKKE
ncbi:MAG: 50S ribosomal protein L25 [Patescibacteria group bacterium]|nr:50S ribosomal protein L25 [Patescibacteria group bacterium]